MIVNNEEQVVKAQVKAKKTRKREKRTRKEAGDRERVRGYKRRISIFGLENVSPETRFFSFFASKRLERQWRAATIPLRREKESNLTLATSKVSRPSLEEVFFFLFVSEECVLMTYCPVFSHKSCLHPSSSSLVYGSLQPFFFVQWKRGLSETRLFGFCGHLLAYGS